MQDFNHFDFDDTNNNRETSPERLALLNQHFDQLHNIYKDMVGPQNKSNPMYNHIRRKSTDGNWLLSHRSPKSQRIPKREFITAPVGHHTGRSDHHAHHTEHRSRYDHHSSRSDGYPNAMQFERRSRSQGRDYSQFVRGGGVMRYARSRSQSPHPLRSIQRSQRHENDVMAAIQMGLEKRQRAIRLSLYQSPDQSDYEWEL